MNYTVFEAVFVVNISEMKWATALLEHFIYYGSDSVSLDCMIIAWKQQHRESISK